MMLRQERTDLIQLSRQREKLEAHIPEELGPFSNRSWLKQSYLKESQFCDALRSAIADMPWAPATPKRRSRPQTLNGPVHRAPAARTK